MSDSLFSFFGRCKRIPLDDADRSQLRASLQQYMEEHPRIDIDSLPPSLRKQTRGTTAPKASDAMSPEEKLALLKTLHSFMHGQEEPAGHSASAPLFFGAWSGTNIFRVLQPFSCTPLSKR